MSVRYEVQLPMAFAVGEPLVERPQVEIRQRFIEPQIPVGLRARLAACRSGES